MLTAFRKNRKRTLALLLAAALLAALLLTGCTTKYVKSDIEDYLRKKGITQFMVSDTYEEIVDDGGFTDKWWTVRTDYYRLPEPLTFHVIDDFYWGMEATTNRLRDDRHSAVMDALRKIHEPAAPLAYPQDGYADFVYPVESRGDFEAAYACVEDFQAFLTNYPKLLDEEFCVEFRFAQDGPDRLLADQSYRVYFAGKTSRAAYLEKVEKSGPDWEDQGLLERYLGRCLRYGLRGRIAEFSAEEIQTCIGDLTLAQVRDTEENVLLPGIVYDDIYDGTIAYGNLYELFQACGLSVQGSWDGFTAVCADGSVRSFSYDDEEPFVDAETASGLLGIAVDNGAPYYETVVDADVIARMGMTADEMAAFLREQATAGLNAVEVSGEDVYVRAKGLQFSRLIRANEAKMDELSETVRQSDGRFRYRIERMHKDYEGISLFFDRADVTPQKQKTPVQQIVAIAYLNQRLACPGEQLSFEVTYYTYQPDTSAMWKEVLTYTLPE